MSSRREQKEALRAQREEERRRAEAASRRKRLVGYGAAGALVAAALIALAVVTLAGGDDGGGGGSGEVYPDGGEVPSPQETDLRAAAKAAGCTLKDERAAGSNHVTQPVTYRSNPPHSGDHFAEAAEDGAYDEAPPTENWVHSLEHGRLVVQFKPSLPPDARANLKKQHDDDPFHMMLFPNATRMPFDIAVSAWTRDPEPLGTGHLLGCPRMNDRVYDAIAAFRSRFRDNDIPPENVP